MHCFVVCLLRFPTMQEEYLFKLILLTIGVFMDSEHALAKLLCFVKFPPTAFTSTGKKTTTCCCCFTLQLIQKQNCVEELHAAKISQMIIKGLKIVEQAAVVVHFSNAVNRK